MDFLENFFQHYRISIFSEHFRMAASTENITASKKNAFREFLLEAFKHIIDIVMLGLIDSGSLEVRREMALLKLVENRRKN